MSNFDNHGGLAALRSQVLASGNGGGGPRFASDDNTASRSGGAPQLPRIQTDVGSAFEPALGSSAIRSNGVEHSYSPPSHQQRESAGSSGGSYSGNSGPSTGFTTPSASLDTKSAHPWTGQNRTSAASSSRGSNSAFAYSDQLSSPGFAMSATMGDEDISFGSGHGSYSGSHSGGLGDDREQLDSPASDSREKSKKLNPLQDLIETETAYVAELSKIIKKVAAAWSRQNLPPPELDTMFRNIEAIYRVNRSFLKSLKEIGPNPSSPRALGDLLMRWIDDLEDPYVRYCDNYFTHFDSWPTIQTNARLKELLVEVSAATTPDGTPIVSSDKKRRAGDLWTLDGLFTLPQTRLKYYKKLYARLLKSTHQGRSDHRLLVGANEKLDELLEKSKSRINMGVLDDSPNGVRERLSNADEASTPTAKPDALGTDNRGSYDREQAPPLQAQAQQQFASLDIGSSHVNARDAVTHEPATPSGGDLPLSPITPGRQAQPPPLIPPIASPQPISPIGGGNSTPSVTGEDGLLVADDLEKTLDMSKVLDLFTMQPKKCQLRINPPTLPFKRGLRKSADVVIDFVPLSTGEECIWRRGHIFLLTDLFLICDRMTPSERSQRNLGPDGMWLLFPPLAGKHLKVTEAGGPGNSLSITILKKEVIKVHVQSRAERDEWLAAFDECNKFATNMGMQIKNGDTAAAPPTGIASPPMSSGGSSLGTLGVQDATRIPSPHASLASSLDRVGSMNSVASFPRVSPNGETTLQPPIGHPDFPSRGPSPGPLANGRPARPDVGGPGGFGARPGGFPRPPHVGNGPPMSPVGPGSPLGIRPSMPGGPPGPRPGMFRPPPPPGSGAMMNGRPPFRPGPGGPAGMSQPPPQQQGARPMRPPPPPMGPTQGRPFRPAQEMRDNMRRPSAPNLRDRQGAITPPVRTRSASSVGSQGAPKLPSEMMKDGTLKNDAGMSPPSSPTLKPSGPTTSTVAAQMRCRLYLKQSHAQWKSLGNARLKLYHIMPANHKQLVVENDKKMLISTIVLTDAVERVGKVGVAVEVSDNGIHTGIIYMLQMRSEESAQGLFGELIDGGSRTVAIT